MTELTADLSSYDSYFRDTYGVLPTYEYLYIQKIAEDLPPFIGFNDVKNHTTRVENFYTFNLDKYKERIVNINELIKDLSIIDTYGVESVKLITPSGGLVLFRKSFKLNSLFQDIYFDTHQPNWDRNLEYKNQSERTLDPVLRINTTDNMFSIEHAPKSKKKFNLKDTKNTGYMPPKQRFKFIIENPASVGTGQTSPNDMRETSPSNRYRPTPTEKPQSRNLENNVEWLQKLSFNLKATELGNIDINEQGYQLMPRRDFSDGFHKRPVTRPGEGHNPFTRGKNPGEGLSKIPVKDLPIKPFFETNPKTTKIYEDKVKPKFKYGEEKSKELNWGSSLYSKYLSELDKYKERVLQIASDVWLKKGVTKEEISNKWDALSDKLDRASKKEFIEIYNSYATELYGPYENFIKRINGVEKEESLNPQPYYYTQNIYPYKGTGPGFSSPTMYDNTGVMTREVRVAKDSVRDFSAEEARVIGDTLGIDWDKVDLEQFRIGLSVELEHGAIDPDTNVTDDDLLMTGKIAWIHLKEVPDYYTKLKKVESIKSFRLASIIVEKDNDFKHTIYKKISAKDNEKEVGYLLYDIDDNTIYIKAIKVDENSRRQNIATSMVNFIKNEFPNRSVDWGVTTREGDYLKKSIEDRKSFKLVALDKPSISQEAYDAFSEKSYVFKNYQLSPEQIEDSIEKGKDLSIILKHQKLGIEQKKRAVQRALEKGVALVYIWEKEKEHLTEEQTKYLIARLHKKAMDDGTNIIYLLKNFELTPEQKDVLVTRALKDGIGLHYMFKNRLLSPEQREFAVSKAIETGYGLLDLLKYENLTEDQRSKVISKCIERGVALIYLLEKEKLNDSQKKIVFDKALREGVGYNYILKRYKLSPEQVALAIRRSRHIMDNLKYILKFQELTTEQKQYVEHRINIEKDEREKQRLLELEQKRGSKEEDDSFMIPYNKGFEELQTFFRDSSNEEVMEMYNCIENNRNNDAKKLLESFIGYEI